MTTNTVSTFTYDLPTFPQITHRDEREIPAARFERLAREFVAEADRDGWWDARQARRSQARRTWHAETTTVTPAAQAEHHDHGAHPQADAVARHNEAVAYVRSYRGTFEFLLDIQARLNDTSRRVRTLTDRQVEAVLKCKARDTERAARQTAASPAETAATPVTVGMWVTTDGRVWKVLPTRDGGHVYAKLLDADEGTFVYVRGGVGEIRRGGGRPMTRDEAAEYGRVTGRCCVCSRLLTDPASIEAGIGPVCIEKMGW